MLLSNLTPDDDGPLLDLLFRDSEHVFVMLDAAKIVGLVERIEMYGLTASCLVGGSDGIELADVLPWVIKVERDTPFLAEVLSDQFPEGLWDTDSGIFLQTSYDLPTLLRHLRKFHRPRIADTDQIVFLKFWDAELLHRMYEDGIAHIQGIVTPDVSIVGRVEDEAYRLSADQTSPARPGTLTSDERSRIGLYLTVARRRLIAGKISETFPEHVSHLRPKAVEREVSDAWDAANFYGLKNGQVRSKFIILSVALAPGLHRDKKVGDLLLRSDDPDQMFRDLETVMNKRFSTVDTRGLL